MRRLNALSKLQNIICKLTDVCAIFSTYIMNIGIALIRFFKKNPNLIGPIITSLATAIIAAYAIYTHNVQKELKQLQSEVIDMQTEPTLSGSIGYNVPGSEHTSRYHYRLTNTGSDTAWAVFPEIRPLILCDTLLIHPIYYLYRLVYSSGVLRGEFGRLKPIAPTETKTYELQDVFEDFIRLSTIIGGVILLEVKLEFWGESPKKKYTEEEYYIYNKKMLFQNDYFEKLTRPEDRLLLRLGSVKDLRKTAEVTSIDYIGLE